MSFSLIVLAGGKGSRLGKYPCPKVLLPLHNRSMLDQIIEFWRADETIVVCNPAIIEMIRKYTNNEHRYVQEYRGSAFSVGAGMEMATHDRMVFNWCDVLPEQKVELSGKFFFTSKEIPCRFDGKMGGIYGVFSWNRKDVTYPRLPDKPDRELDLLDVLPMDDFTEFQIPAIDIGDDQKYKECLRVSERPVRPFNTIVVGDTTVTKICSDKRLKEAEENWYKEMSGFDFVAQPISYDPLVLKRIYGIQRFDAAAPLYDLARQIHARKDPISANKDDCIDMYIRTTLTRLRNIEYLTDFGDDFFVNGLRCSNPIPILENIDMSNLLPEAFTPIHGDLTTSNVLWEGDKPYIIDPRGIFGGSLLYGDPDYDVAKIHYSLTGWHLLNKGCLAPEIIANNSFRVADVPLYGSRKIDFLLATIWLSVTDYVRSNVLSVTYSYLLGSYLLNKWVNTYKESG
jgi:hypothetical protein